MFFLSLFDQLTRRFLYQLSTNNPRNISLSGTHHHNISLSTIITLLCFKGLAIMIFVMGENFPIDFLFIIEKNRDGEEGFGNSEIAVFSIISITSSDAECWKPTWISMYNVQHQNIVVWRYLVRPFRKAIFWEDHFGRVHNPRVVF